MMTSTDNTMNAGPGNLARLVYITPDNTVFRSASFSAVYANRSMDAFTEYALGDGERFAKFLECLHESVSSDIGQEAIKMENAVPIVMQCDTYAAQWEAGTIILRDDGPAPGHGVMEYDGLTRAIVTGTVTEWQMGKLYSMKALVLNLKPLPACESETSGGAGADSAAECTAEDRAVTDCCNQPGTLEDKLRAAYRRGYADATVTQEVARFERIWTDEASRVNGGRIAPMLSLFLTTVSENSRNMVCSAILDKYRQA